MIKLSKNIFLLLLFVSSLSADYLMTVTMNDKREDYTFSRCINYYYTSDHHLSFNKSINGITNQINFLDIKEYTIVSGFYLDYNNKCVKYTRSLSDTSLDSTLPLNANTLSYLGLSDSDLNMMFGFSGILISFLFLFGLFRWI